MAIGMQAPLRRMSGFVLLALLGLSAYQPQARTQNLEPQGLFEEAAPTASLDEAVLGPFIRQRAVRIAWPPPEVAAPDSGARAASLPDRLVLNLFPDVQLIAERRRLPSTGIDETSWIGVVAGVPVSYVNLTSAGAAVSGTVQADSRVFEIVPRGDSGEHVIVERQPGATPPEGVPIRPPDGFAESETDRTSAAVLDSGNVLDVMYLYTPALKAAYGGEAGIRLRLSQVAVGTNAIYANSRIPGLRVRIVAIKEVNYVQAPNDMHTDLEQLRQVDNVIDQVHVWRNSTGADLVQLIVGQSNYCGLAYLMGPGADAGFAPLAFSVTADNCLWQYTSAHEMGHNLGSNHEATDVPNGVGAFNYSYGYKDPNRQFRTVMAYECSGGTCPRVPLFSDDDLRYNGLVAGGPLAQNATSIAETRYTAANWRSARFLEDAPGQTGTPQVVTVGGLTTISWTLPMTGGGATGYKLYVGRSPGASDIGTFIIGAPTVTGVLPSGIYYLRVAALNHLGHEGPPSEEAPFTIAGPQAPGAPTGLTASVAGNIVTLAWVAPNTGGAVSGYTVEGGPASGATAGSGGSAGTVFVTPPLADGVYFARVRAYNDVGRSGPSNEVSFRLGTNAAPGPPRNLSGTTRGSDVSLGWQAPASGGAPADYLIEAGSASGLSNYGTFPVGNALGMTTRAPAGRFFVRVRARNSVATSAPSNEIVLTTGVNTCVGDFAARLDWNTRTDIDLHVNEPSGFHVYYGRKVGPTARLDVDNTSGYGPENICVGTGAAVSGTYRIYVVPYSGSVWPTTTTIDVRVFVNTSRESSRTVTRLLPAAQSSLGYNVANVTFPGGTITEVTGTRGVSDLIPTLSTMLFQKGVPQY